MITFLQGPPSKGRLDENLYTELERLTLSCTVTWAQCDKVHLYKQHMTIQLTKTRTYVTYSGPGLLPHVSTGYGSQTSFSSLEVSGLHSDNSYFSLLYYDTI